MIATLVLLALAALGVWWFVFRTVKTPADTQPVVPPPPAPKPFTPLADALANAKLEELPPKPRELPHVVKRKRKPK